MLSAGIVSAGDPCNQRGSAHLGVLGCGVQMADSFNKIMLSAVQRSTKPVWQQRASAGMAGVSAVLIVQSRVLLETVECHRRC